MEEIIIGNMSVNELKYPLADPPLYGDSDYKDKGGKIFHVQPKEFLKLVKPLKMDEETKENIDDLYNMIVDGQEIDPPALYVEYGRVIDHDGRHRCYAAIKAGTNKVPVLVIDRNHQPVETFDFKPQMKKAIQEIIKEELSLFFENKKGNHSSYLKSNIKFIKEFGFKPSSSSKGVYEFSLEKYKNIYTIKIFQKLGSWYLEGFIDGRLKHHSSNFNIGPAKELEDFVELVNDQMENNPILSPLLIHDEKGLAVDEEIDHYIELIRKNKSKIKSVDLPVFDEIKDLLKIIVSHKASIEKLRDQLMDMYNSNHGLLNQLRKVDQLPFYKTMDKYHDVEKALEDE